MILEVFKQEESVETQPNNKKQKQMKQIHNIAGQKYFGSALQQKAKTATAYKKRTKKTDWSSSRQRK